MAHMSTLGTGMWLNKRKNLVIESTFSNAVVRCGGLPCRFMVLASLNSIPDLSPKTTAHHPLKLDVPQLAIQAGILVFFGFRENLFQANGGIKFIEVCHSFRKWLIGAMLL